uniref:histidine kinase n=1 Tax=Roseihalotalea indica TaxID=2867963 RepID=A0AA49GTT1_9BACT|nr:ATP-binding protein [Tunicatimonas sp. TK19036]
METPIPLYSSLRRWSYILVGIVIVVAILVLLGWSVNLDLLKRVLPGVVAMNPLTATLFLFSGSAFFLLSSARTSYHITGYILITLVVLAALTKLIEYALGVEGGIDTILFSRQLEADRIGNISNSMAINTAFCYLLFGCALWLAHRPTQWEQNLAIYFALGNLFIVLLSIIGYIYVVDFFYAILAQVPMALHTAINFLLLSLALLFAYPNRGVISDLVSPLAGGVLARRLIPPIFLIPIMLGAIILLGEWQKFYGLDFGIAFFCLGVILLFLPIVWRAVNLLNHFDAAREKADTALREANQGLATRSAQLEATNHELESFSYSVSHDLRAPLRAISGYSELFQEDYETQLDDSGKQMLKTINSNAEKMGRLIDDLLRFSKIGRSGLKPIPLDMEKLANDTFQELTMANQQPIAIDIQPMPMARGDYTLIALLYQNLISNAIKYSSKKKHPQIQIGVNIQEGMVIYFVKDNGAGFDMRHYNKLFGVFHRLHKGTDFEGTGVGLAIAHKIVLAHDGKIWAEGMEGEGATFYFTLKKPSSAPLSPENP